MPTGVHNQDKEESAPVEYIQAEIFLPVTPNTQVHIPKLISIILERFRGCSLSRYKEEPLPFIGYWKDDNGKIWGPQEVLLIRVGISAQEHPQFLRILQKIAGHIQTEPFDPSVPAIGQKEAWLLYYDAKRVKVTLNQSLGSAP